MEKRFDIPKLAGEPTEMRPEWFQVYIEANSQFPQTQDLISILVFNELLQGPPTEWKDFFLSTFTAAQMVYIKKLLSNIHTYHNIPATLEGKEPQPDTRVITDQELHGVWRVTKTKILVRCHTFAGIVDSGHTPKSFYDIAAIQSTFNDERYHVAFDELKNVMRAQAYALACDVVKKEAKKFRKNLAGITDPEKRREAVMAFLHTTNMFIIEYLQKNTEKYHLDPRSRVDKAVVMGLQDY